MLLGSNKYNCTITHTGRRQVINIKQKIYKPNHNKVTIMSSRGGSQIVTHLIGILETIKIELGGTTNAFYFLICITEKLI